MRIFTGLFILIFLTLAAHGQVLINEVLASNLTGLVDEDGEYGDWIEIYNAGASSVNLEGYSLTDNDSFPARWTFPELNIGSGSHVLVFASGKDRKMIDLSYQTLIDWGDSWKYLVPSGDIGTAWHDRGYDDAAWTAGASGFGYSDGDDATEIPATLSVFIRKEFTITDVASVQRVLLHMDYDDGFVAYINGVEIARANLGVAGTIVPFDRPADGDHEANLWQGFNPEVFEVHNPRDFLVNGTNVIAIQGHNRDITSSDLSLIPFLTFGNTAGIQEVSSHITVPSAGGLHTNFKIKSEGESLYLYNATGTYLDSMGAVAIPIDVSYGRKPDGTAQWVYFAEPTPEAANATPGAGGEISSIVSFSPAGGKHLGGTSINLTTGDATDTIYYTTDGSIPTRSSIRFTGSLNINGDQVIRARVIKAGSLPGPVATNTYVIRNNHQIPVVCISTDPDNLWSDDLGIYILGPDYEAKDPHYGANYWEEWERPVHFELYDTNGEKKIDQGAGIKIMGGWSRMAEQKSVALFARKDYGKGSFDYQFFADKPMDKFEAIVLRNSGNDNMRLQFHDCFMTGLTREMNIDRQAFQPAAVYLNGEYWGIENIREKVNEHFLAGNHGVDPDNVNLLEYHSDVIFGTNEDYLAILSFLNGHSDLANDDDYLWVRNQIDLDNYIQYQLTQIYLNNQDWPSNNIKYWNTTTGKPWRWILFDTDFGFMPNEYGENTLAFALATNGLSWPNPPWSTLFFRRMVSNLEFRYNFITQYCDRMNVDFHSSRVNADLDSLKALYYDDMAYHFDRWWGSYNQWEQQISQRKTFGYQRPSRARLHLQQQFNLGEEFEIELDVSDETAGKIRINTVSPKSYPFTGIYFEDIPIKLTAIPRPGYKFVVWEGTSTSGSAVITYDMATEGNFKAIFAPATAEDISIVINEINYSSSADWDTKDWIELLNNGNTAIDMDGWLISDTGIDTGHYFQAGIVLYPGDYLVVCRDLVDFRSFNPNVINSIGNIPFGLSGSGDIIRLYDAEGNLMDAVDYYPYAPWPTNAVGTGSTIELKDPSLDNAQGQNWQAIGVGGTPGKPNFGYLAIEQVKRPALLTQFESFPNPFTDYTTIQFTVAEEGDFRLEVYDIKGQLLEVLTDEFLVPDTYSIDWYGDSRTNTKTSGGIYLVRLSSGKQIETIKLLMIK